MAGQRDIATICETLRTEYGICDIADSLDKLGVPKAGFLSDILPRSNPSSSTTLVAPVSTVLFVPKTHQAGTPGTAPNSSLGDESIPWNSNLSPSSHWTDTLPPGSIAVIKQPPGQVCAVVGDILATRLKIRGVKGVVVDGRVRDLTALKELCADGSYTAWSRATSVVTSGLETKPWAVDCPLNISGVEFRPGDIICADEAEQGVVVIPQDRLKDLLEILPKLTKADAARVQDIKDGMDVATSFKRNPK